MEHSGNLTPISDESRAVPSLRTGRLLVRPSRMKSEGMDALCSLFADREAGQGRKQCEDERKGKSRRVAAGQIVYEPARVGSESAAQMMDQEDRPREGADVLETIEITHQGRGQRGRGHKRKTE